MASHRLTREDVVLLLASSATGRYNLDRFRLMKGCFLVSEAGQPEWKDLFSFRAYDYGPFDPSVYSVRDGLVMDGMLDVDEGARYEAYRLTPAGARRADELMSLLGEADAEWFQRLGRWLTSNSFSSIANQVYAAFPDFATRSVLRQ
jgi:uncharacterized protein